MPRKRFVRPVAALSAITLALGTFGAIPPGPVAPEIAAAADLTGGIRGADGNGVIDRGAQRTSDLRAGSCVVDSGAPSGSQAGFSWNNLEPGPTSPSKTRWGLSVAFDNSKDRTFADWSFSNSGLMGAYLDAGQVPSMGAGQTFLGNNVTDKADEILGITASRQQRNLNLYAKLTDAKVKQFAEATAANPVRYAWQGNYKQENPDGPRATQGTSSSFKAVVNPWPSENIECNPITVSWEKISKHVIVPDEETKVGHINVPAVQNDGTDDSLSRMVVEAYDGNGEFIGTSDTSASNGGEKRVRIDEKGDIYYTWPKYRDPENADKSTESQKLAAQQNVNFSVIAKPRSVDQLQAAVESNNGGEGAAFESSNSLARYSKPNVIENRSFSLDDTGNHDPQYDSYQRTIISGVDSVTGPLAKGRQSVTFKQIPDKIADLVKEKGQGGYEATVKLNNDYVFDEWDAEIDPNTHDVTITAPENAQPGTFAQARVIVTYSNGSKDEIPLLVAVEANDTQTTDVSYPFQRAPQTVEMKADPQFKKILKKDRPVRKPRIYELREGWTAPQGWTVSVDKWSGVVTAKSDETVPDNTILEVPVVATYWDTTTDEATAKFQVASSVKVPGYDAASGKASEEVKLPAKMPKIGLGGSEDDEEPNRYTFENGETTFEPEATDPNYQWKFAIDEKTGEITATIPTGALPGAYYSVPVKAHYASGAPAQNTTATVSVVGSGDGEDVAHYIAQTTRAGVSVDSKINTQLSDPKLAKYELGKIPEGWKAEIADDGTVTATPGEDQKPGTEVEIPVNISYPGGGKGTTTAKFVVVGNDAQNNDPLYPTVTVVRGETAKNPLNTDNIDTGRVQSFEVITDPNAPGYIKPPQNLDLSTVSIDQETGTVITPVKTNTLPGTSADIPVKVTYKDGSVDYTLATVVVKGQRSQVYEPQYKQKVTKPGEGIESDPVKGTEVAEQHLGETGFTVPDEVDGWKVQVDQKTGQVTATPPKTARSGDAIEVPVTIEYEDGSKDTVYAPFLVREKESEFHSPSYDVESTKPGGEVTHKIKNVPEGAKFEAPQEDGGWNYTIDAAGNLTATAPKDAKPGDKKTTNVTVTYPDGSTDEVPVTTVVALSNNYEAEPFYPPEKSYPGETATSPLNVRKAEGIDLAEENPFAIIVQDGFTPTGQNNAAGNPIYRVSTANGVWLVSLDEDGNVKADIPATAQPGDNVQVPVRLTYSDGSTDTTTASITVVDNPTRPIPFKVEYQYDATMPAGKSEVVTQGEAGSEKQLRDGTWETTKPAVNEVVKIGVKPAENSEDVSWTVPIPYSTEMRPNPALAPGETKVVQEGENGERKFTAKFRSVGDESYVVDSEDNKQPVKEIIEYGPRLEGQDLVTTTERQIPFETTIIPDDTLPAGERRVDTQGVVGVEKVTSTQKLVDGKPSGDPVVTTTTVTEKQDAVIRVGTKTEGETVNTHEAEIPFGVKVEFDSSMPAGTSETVTEGKPGKKTITVTQKVTNSQPDGKATVEEKVTEQPVDQVIKVGTKPTEASEKVTWTAQVPFEVETRPNPELKPGEIKVVQKGVPGEKTYTADFTAKGDQATVTPEEKQTKAPVNEIIEYGPRAKDTTVVTKTEKPIPFETEIVFDDSIESGKEFVEQAGVTGVEVETSTQKIVDGKPEGDPEVKTERTKEPTKQIIRVGTKTTGTNTETFTTEAPYKVVVKYDPNMPAGQSEVTTKGVPGEKTVTIERNITNSKPDAKPTITEEITKQPVDEVITVGTKQATATDKVEWTEPIPFGTILRPNSALKPGEIKVVQEGKNGEASYAAVFVGTNGEATVKETKARTEPIERIVEYGPAKDPQESSVVTKTEKPVPFETEIVFDGSLKAGEQVVDQQGEFGTDVVTSTQKIVDGKPSGEPTVTTERTKEPTNAVIRVGTKTENTHTTESEVEVPFETEVIYDDTMEAGTSEVVQEGQPGKDKVTTTQTIVNSQVTDTKTETERVTEPVNKVIKIGTKIATDSTTVEWTENTPFEIEVRPNSDLKAGEHRVLQEGKPGEVKHTVTVTSENGQITKSDPTTETISDPVKHIIEVGTKCDCEPPEDSEDPKPEDPKPEDPKPEDPKPEDPKPEDPKDPENPTDPDNPTDPEDPDNPKDPNTPGGSTGSVTPKPNLPGIIGSLGIGGAIVGSGSLGSTPKPDPKQPGKPGTPNKPDSKQPSKPGTPNKPGKPGKPDTPDKSSPPSQSGTTDSTSTGSSASSGSSSSQKQVDSPRMSTLASTGANVLGVFAVGLALIIGAIPLLRRRREEGEA
ncbi:G5 domain-containing protein [Corynebacterium sp. HMSC08A12]|uniref:G5 domain-containing protein n=1 Tax=Corynebacterium sp. HMSC08A12 TaxID=1581134 RepID=UPI0009F23022